MIGKLYIQNYAIIDKLEINFSTGLNIITGETGAGKSIILGALSLLLGERADSSTLRNREEKCIIEASIDLDKLNLEELFEDLNLEYESETIIRREIQPGGKSRAFINDSPVTLNVLGTLCNTLVDLHRQHETLGLGKSSFQLNLVDTVAQQQNDINEYQKIFHQYSQLQVQINELKKEQSRLNAESDFNQFQLNELVEANLEIAEQEELENEMKVLEHAEQIKKTISEVLGDLAEAEMNTISRLKISATQVASIAKINQHLISSEEKIRSVIEELKDVQSKLEDEFEAMNFDPERLEEINSRLDIIYRLQKKHRVNDVASLKEIQNQLQEKVSSVFMNEDAILALEKEIESVRKVLLERAEKISKNRKSNSTKIEKKVNALLKEVGMPDAQIKIEISSDSSEPAINGIDKIEILFTANKGARMEAINKVASGGELSRLMLCLKSLVASTTQLPTLIFDEIDAGISGETSQKVGKLMKEMSNGHQLICITHLPQIAAKADKHFFVYKETIKGITYSRLRQLDEGERVVEIAKMLSGDSPGKAALQNAKELIEF